MNAIVTNIPEEIRELNQWVNWQLIVRNGESTKKPVNPKTGHGAKVNDHRTWASFTEALNSSRQLGFVFTGDDVYVGVDVDNCVKDGVIHPSTEKLMHRLDSYAEFSPSGTGVHIFVKGTLPERLGGTNGDRKIEVYSEGRFFTMTGKHIAGTPMTINHNQDEIDRMVKALRKEKPVREPRAQTYESKEPDDVVLAKAMNNAKTGEAFRKLWAGDKSAYKNDWSRADYWLIDMLRYWTNGDEEQMDRLFRQSGLMRDKWDEEHGAMTYGEMTIQNALKRGNYGR